MKYLFPALLSLALCSCANYQMGSTPKAPGMTDIKVIYLPTVQNETDETDIPGIVSNAILQEIDRDGTFRHGRKDASDAILEVTVKKIERVPIRQSTEQFLTTLQYQLVLIVEYRLYNMKEKKDAISKTMVTGTTTFFVGGDQTESQRQAFPVAAVSVAQALVANLANRGWYTLLRPGRGQATITHFEPIPSRRSFKITSVASIRIRPILGYSISKIT